MLAEVKRRKAAILLAIHRRDFPTVRVLVDDLVEYQRGGEAEHIAKSLCDLAMEAKTLGIFSLQLELTERSSVIKELTASKRVQIVSGVYSLTSGGVDWLKMPKTKWSVSELVITFPQLLR